MDQARMLRKYGLSHDEYWYKAACQSNLCAICGEPEQYKSPRGKVVNLAVDHDHTTDKLRDLLCRRCNLVLGLVSDNTLLLEAMTAYIRRHK